MSVFGFIENFFFISLAIVFALVVFLVYHFKNRITVAEKKSESMYGLLTAVVKEIKTLRGMFGLGGTEPVGSEESVAPFRGQTKTTPEVIVSTITTESTTNDSFVEKSDYNKSGFLEYAREVITLEMSPSEKKIVVSDYEEDSSDESESVSEIESDLELELESEEVNDTIECVNQQSFDLDIIDLAANDDKLSYSNSDTFVEPGDSTMQRFENDDEQKEPEMESDGVVILSELELSQEQEQAPLTQDTLVDNVSQQIPSLEQLRKMNINQLKQIASQLGITTDVSKMKKPDLILLIRECGEVK